MKYTLTIEANSTAELGAVLAKLDGIPMVQPVTNATVAAATAGTTLAQTTAPITGAGHTDEDDGGVADANAPTTDSTGLPWDGRIHSSNRKLTSKGVWVMRRNTPDNVIQQVEAELRARTSGPATNAAPQPQAQPQPVFNSQPVFTPNTTMQAQPQFTQQQPQPQFQQQQPFTQPGQPMVQQDYTTLFNTIQGLFNTGAADPIWLQGLNQRLGINSITDIQHDPNKVNDAFTLLRQDGKIQ